MQRTPLQTELPLRKRVMLIEDTEEVTLRVPALVAKAVERKSYEALAYLMCQGAEPLMETVKRREQARKPPEALDAYLMRQGPTEWFTGPPPRCSGFYEVRQKSARDDTKHLRMWYDAEHNYWVGKAPTWESKLPIPHATLIFSHFWRGLREPAIGGYTYRVPGQRVRLIEGDQA